MRRISWVVVTLALLVGLLPIGVRAVELDVDGKSALLMDVATGSVLYENNAHEKLAPASVTKVMTMLLIMEAIDGGKIGWEDQVVASEAAAAKGGSQIYLKVGETMSVAEMVKSIAVSSANDCACAMAEHIAGSESAFVDMMNRRAAELGMQDTHFVNCTGLDDDPEAKAHKTSAHDIAIMSRELLKNHPDIKKYTTIWMDTIRNGTFGLSNTNKLVRFYNGATGLKTGYTSQAGYCLSASAERDGMELIAVVMGAETSDKRFETAKSLLNFGFANYTLMDVHPSQALPPVDVLMGVEETIQPVLERSSRILVDKSVLDKVTTELNLAEDVEAPVEAGQKLGSMIVRVDGVEQEVIDIVADRAVDRLTVGGIFSRFMEMLFMKEK